MADQRDMASGDEGGPRLLGVLGGRPGRGEEQKRETYRRDAFKPKAHSHQVHQPEPSLTRS